MGYLKEHSRQYIYTCAGVPRAGPEGAMHDFFEFEEYQKGVRMPFFIQCLLLHCTRQKKSVYIFYLEPSSDGPTTVTHAYY